MKLLLGAGDNTLDGFATVDLREDTNPDFVADVRKLGFCADGSVDEIVAHDILEHMLPWEIHDVLSEWNRVLEPGGMLELKVPNMKMLGRWLADDYRTEAAITNIFGGHKWGTDGDLDTHHYGWTPETIQRDLASAGFEVLSQDFALNMTVCARKVGEPK